MKRILTQLSMTLVALAVGFVLTSASDGQSKGRYKKDGTKCTWDANDTGPNQCTPTTAGRFKKDGDKCVWASGDTGDDQCTPVKGRFKKDGNRCNWDAEDSGPNQCDPRQSK